MNKIGYQIINELEIANAINEVYYVKDNFSRVLKHSEDSIFIDDDEIIDHIKKMIAGEYTLEVNDVQREYVSSWSDIEDNFFYKDRELKLIKN